MATNTENYGLTKPAQDDFYDINVHNGNMDKIDAALKDNADNLEKHKAGASIKVVVSVDSGSIVTATNGTDTLTDTATDGSVTFLLPSYGTWTFSASSGGYNSNTVTIEVDAVKLYAVKLTFFSATITVSVMNGAEVSIYSSDGDVQTAVSTGQVTFTVKEAGSYGITARYENGVATETINVTTSGANYSASLGFSRITVSVDAGSTIIVSNGAHTYTKLGTGNDTFWLPQSGTWTVSASLGSNTSLTNVTLGEGGHPVVTLVYYKVYGVSIDLNNSNPETAVTYTDDAVGMTAGSSAWDSANIYKDIKPCLLKDGVVQHYLNPANFAQKADGTPADITSGSSGDVMIEIPKVGYKITKTSNTLIVQITDNPNASGSGFKYYAHTRQTEGDRGKLYVGAYLGSVVSERLRSLSGATAGANLKISEFRTKAQANGNGYDILSFYPRTLLQCLYLIRYKNLDSQTALGKGCTGKTAADKTGTTDANGMYYGSTSNWTHVKFAGVEDFWGNLSCWLDGIRFNATKILTAYSGFNDNGEGYKTVGTFPSAGNISGYMKVPYGTTETGFFPSEFGGSETTYYADNCSIGKADSPVTVGGYYYDSNNAGAFQLLCNLDPEGSASSIGARLMYL